MDYFKTLKERIRLKLLRNIKAETPLLHSLQVHCRSRLADKLFFFLSLLGNHTSYLVGLPILFWFGWGKLARHLTLVAAEGVYVTNFLKDLFGLPRPLSPPVIRLTPTKEHSDEFGFPSTHCTNAVGMTLYYALCRHQDTGKWAMGETMFLAVLSLHIVFSRLYCGMHSITDVVGGSIIGITIALVHFSALPFLEQWLSASSNVSEVALVAILFLYLLHPTPFRYCPCFVDSVCFLAVAFGVLHASSGSLSKFSLSFVPGIIATLSFVILGIIVLLSWRISVKALGNYLKQLFPVLRSSSQVSSSSIDFHFSRYDFDNLVRFVNYSGIAYYSVSTIPWLFEKIYYSDVFSDLAIKSSSF